MVQLPRQSPEPKLVQLIYETSMTNANWHDVLAELNRFTTADSSVLIGLCSAVDPKPTIICNGIAKGLVGTPETLAAVHSASFTMGNGALRVIDLHQTLEEPAEEQLSLTFGKQGQLIFLVISKDGPRRVVLILHSPSARAGQLIAEKVLPFLPHLQTTLAIQKAILIEHDRAERLERLFTRSNVPWVVTTRDNEIMLTNRSFERLADRSNDVLQYRDGILELNDEKIAAEIKRLTHIVGNDDEAHEVAWIPGRDAASGWLVGVESMIARNGSGVQFKNVFVNNDPLILLSFREIGGKSSLTPDLIRTVLGFTPTEAGLACLLANGEAPSDVAKHRGVSKNTVHNQLTSAMARLGFHRQLQLIHLLAVLSFFIP